MERGKKEYLASVPLRRGSSLASSRSDLDQREEPPSPRKYHRPKKESKESKERKDRKKGGPKAEPPAAVGPRPAEEDANGNWAAELGFPAAPKAANGDDDDDARSVRSDFSVRTAVVAQHGAGQPQDAKSVKKALKEFVQALVKGRTFNFQPKGGGPLRSVPCKLSGDTNTFQVGATRPQSLKLTELLCIHRGLEAVPLSLGFEANASNVVLEMLDGSCVTFHLGSPESAEEFTLNMRLLTAMQRQKRRKLPAADGGGGAAPSAAAADNDDARSECSVRTANVQQQMNCTPMSTLCEDPKEIKKMFRMFKETMKRGRDFYVINQDGTLQDCELSMPKGLDQLRMRWEFQERVIALREMLHIRSSKEVASLGLGFSVDERCATLELQSGECITFKFGHAEACERFILCMRIAVDQKRSHFVSQGLAGRTGSSASLSSAASGGGAPAASSSSGRKGSKASAGAEAPPPAAKKSVAAPGSAGGQAAAVDARAMVEGFVRKWVVGCMLEVVGPGGAMQMKCTMDPDLKGLKFSAHDGSSRQVEMTTIKAVHIAAEAKALDLDGIAVDERCGTIELVSGDCITFRFKDQEELKQFALCMRVFLSAYRQ